MKQILAIQKEIIKLQDEHLTPFKFLETTYDKASTVRDRLNKAAKDIYKQTPNFSKLNKHRANTVAWWSSLLEIATDTIENLEELPLDCKLAINYAIASEKLPKNYVRRKTEQLLKEKRQAALQLIEPQQPEPLYEEILVQYLEPETNDWIESKYQCRFKKPYQIAQKELSLTKKNTTVTFSQSLAQKACHNVTLTTRTVA